MRAVIQRVDSAKVIVLGQTVDQIDRGLLVYLGVKEDDGTGDLDYIFDKTVNLRIFEDGDGKMNLSLKEAGGSILVVSQFTLYGDLRRGRRPSFSKAAGLARAEDLYNRFVEQIKDKDIYVATGVFGAHMEVISTNDGPVTILLDSEKTF